MTSERIEFLCPSGHQLHGPVTLAGRAGQCPHCGMRFRIPSLEEMHAAAQDTGIEESAYEQPVEEEVAAEYEAGDQPPAGATEEYVEEYVEEVPEEVAEEPVAEYVEEYYAEAPAEAAEEFGFFDAGEQAATTVTGPYLDAGAAAAVHPMAELFAELWRHKAEGAIVELHLGNNETVHAEHYAPALSQRSLGVFAIRDVGGSYTLTAIAWDLINRVSVRGVKQLPEGMFD